MQVTFLINSRQTPAIIYWEFYNIIGENDMFCTTKHFYYHIIVHIL